MPAPSQEKPGLGKSLQDWLEEEGIADEVTTNASRSVLAWLVKAEMKKQSLSRAALAERLEISEKQARYLLNPRSDKVHIRTLFAAAHLVGRNLKIELI